MRSSRDYRGSGKLNSLFRCIYEILICLTLFFFLIWLLCRICSPECHVQKANNFDQSRMHWTFLSSKDMNITKFIREWIQSYCVKVFGCIVRISYLYWTTLYWTLFWFHGISNKDVGSVDKIIYLLNANDWGKLHVETFIMLCSCGKWTILQKSLSTLYVRSGCLSLTSILNLGRTWCCMMEILLLDQEADIRLQSDEFFMFFYSYHQHFHRATLPHHTPNGLLVSCVYYF